ncbi:tripartite tricarboxylate transporter substrate binding protein [Oceanobacillus locisalsi]|uniref:Tripartite tricarboxylate transporter substrate binding protein n=1 Tax=Oceanobacillus locisalsi TaxID=546107 RepID=A0ABW3NH34_9BACI
MKDTVNFFIKGLAVVFLIVIMSACSDGESSSAADEYPSQPIEVTVPVGAGGDTDLNTRITAKYLEQELDQSIVVSNVEGSGGSTGINEVLSKESDGYSVLAYHNAMLVNNIYGLADYTSEDFKYAGVGILDQSNTFLASKDAPFDDIESLIEYAEANPGEVNVATEVGAMTHLQVLEFEQKTGVEFNVVDAGGASDKITALLGGRVDIVPTSLGLVQEYIESGDFVSLGIIADERLEGAPDVETFAEQGVDMSVDKVFYWAFDPETPDEVVETFSEALKNVVEDESYQEEVENNWLTPAYLNPEETAEKLQEITEHNQEVYDASDQ